MKRPRKHRRLSLRQAINCELGLTRDKRNRCRCGGQFRGARRCGDVPADPKTLRWCFARLAPTDPHYIPPQRRRIFEKSKYRRADGPRRAVQTLAHAMGHIHRTALTAAPGGGVQTVPAPPAIAVETAAKTLRAACVQADGEVKALRLANESRRRAYKFARGLFDPAAVLVSAVKFLSAVGGDSLAQALLLQAKLDLARDAVDDGRPPDRVVYAVVGGQGSGVLAGRLFRDPWKIVRLDFRRSGSVWAMGRRGRNVLGIGFPRLCDETFILLRASVVGSCATKKDAYAARGDMSARSRRGL